MKRLKALRGSLDKWIGICEGTVIVWRAGNECALCKKYWERLSGCSRCPLVDAGKGCLPSGSTWDQIMGLLGVYKRDCGESEMEHKEYIDDIPSPKLLPLCVKMRDTLQGIYDEEKAVE